MRRALISIAAAAALAGCGNERTRAPDIGSIPKPTGFREAIYGEHGVTFKAPKNWRVVDGLPPQLATVAIGDAQIGVWRYPRSEPLPETRAQLQAARKALIAQVEGRDASFDVTSSRVVLRRGLRAVEVVGVGSNLTNRSERRTVRSLHAYGHGAEVVLDAFAPPSQFKRVDRQTFQPALRSLKLRRPRG